MYVKYIFQCNLPINVLTDCVNVQIEYTVVSRSWSVVQNVIYYQASENSTRKIPRGN